MLDEKQRATIKDLFGSGINVSEIAREVGVSRQSVCHVIVSDVEKDPEIQQLKKEVKKAQLRREIKKLKEATKRDEKLDDVSGALDNLVSKVLRLWDTSPEVPHEAHRCVYCGAVMEHAEKKRPHRANAVGYRCRECKKEFLFP